VDLDGDVPLAPTASSEADVIAVAMGEDDRPDVVERAAHRRQLGRESPQYVGAPASTIVTDPASSTR
jgi:hypothetical protein